LKLLQDGQIAVADRAQQFIAVLGAATFVVCNLLADLAPPGSTAAAHPRPCRMSATTPAARRSYRLLGSHRLFGSSPSCSSA